jgi:hypothetical protein
MSGKSGKTLHRPVFLIVGLVFGIFPVFLAANGTLNEPGITMLFGLVFVFMAFVPKKEQ